MSDIKVALPTVITNKDLTDGRAAEVTVDNALKVALGETSSGTVCYQNYFSDIGVGNTEVAAAYTVNPGDTFVLKSITASASSGPCKVLVELTDSSDVVIETLFIGFFSSVEPTLQVLFPATISIASTDKVRVRVKNNAVASQDAYATIMGRII